MRNSNLWPVATFLVALVILWQIDTMNEAADRNPKGPQETGETHESGGVITPRYYIEGTTEREPDAVWVTRHFDSVKAFRLRKAQLEAEAEAEAGTEEG